MSSKSPLSSSHTAPIVRRLPPVAAGRVTVDIETTSTVEERQLELADLQLVTIAQAVGLDTVTVHVRSIQALGVLDVQPVGPTEDHGVLAGDRDVVEQDVGGGGAADRGALGA